MRSLPVTITDVAIAEIKNILLHKGIPTAYALRIGSKGSGCSGISHYLGFDLQKDSDESYEYQEIKILIEKKDFMHLIGIQLDFIENDQQRGFVFG